MKAKKAFAIFLSAWIGFSSMALRAADAQQSLLQEKGKNTKIVKKETKELDNAEQKIKGIINEDENIKKEGGKIDFTKEQRQVFIRGVVILKHLRRRYEKKIANKIKNSEEVNDSVIKDSIGELNNIKDKLNKLKKIIDNHVENGKNSDRADKLLNELSNQTNNMINFIQKQELAMWKYRNSL